MYIGYVSYVSWVRSLPSPLPFHYTLTHAHTHIHTYSVQTEWLDGKHVVFGKVVKGLDTVRAMEKQGNQSGVVSRPVVVADCGEL